MQDINIWNQKIHNKAKIMLINERIHGTKRRSPKHTNRENLTGWLKFRTVAHSHRLHLQLHFVLVQSMASLYGIAPALEPASRRTIFIANLTPHHIYNEPRYASVTPLASLRIIMPALLAASLLAKPSLSTP